MCLLRVTKKQSNNLLGRGRKSVLLIEHLQIRKKYFEVD